MAKERHFWTGSVGIIGDPRPSGLDMRVYACVSLHDGMSRVHGGRGCYATFETLTARLGCDKANLSRSLKRLINWGYLSEERQEDGRRKAYRVIFEGLESWQSRKRSGERRPADLPTIDPQRLPKSPTTRPEIVGNAESLNGRKQSEKDEHYISLKELDSSEEDELNSDESARLAARDMLQVDIQLGDRANLAILKRALKSDAPIDLVEWYAFLLIVLDRATGTFVKQVFRISEELAGHMTASELEAARRRASYVTSILAKTHRQDSVQRHSAPGQGASFVDIAVNPQRPAERCDR